MGELEELESAVERAIRDKNLDELDRIRTRARHIIGKEMGMDRSPGSRFNRAQSVWGKAHGTLSRHKRR